MAHGSHQRGLSGTFFFAEKIVPFKNGDAETNGMVTWLVYRDP